MSRLIIALIFSYFVLSDSISVFKYLIKQGSFAKNHSLYLYAPYILWNEHLLNQPISFESPREIRSVNNLLDISLTVESRIVSNELFSFRTRLFCFQSECSYPGPTLYVNPGDSVVIRLTNHLENTSTPIYDTSKAEIKKLYPNRTNIFFYGLHLDPFKNSPYRYTQGGGDSIIYRFVIPIDSNPGTHWYQSRVSGYSAMQVMGGLHVRVFYILFLIIES